MREDRIRKKQKSIMERIEMVSLDQLVSKEHNYRKFKELWNFGGIEKKLWCLKSSGPHEGYGIYRLFKCLLVQFMEDLSDRELEAYLQENVAGKWFCGFSLMEKTPDYSVFSKVRGRIGTKLLSEIFEELRHQLKSKGYMSEVFTFVDASHLVSKANLWQERDKAIQAKYEKLNNEILPKVAHDKQAKIGCKGGNKFWYGIRSM